MAKHRKLILLTAGIILLLSAAAAWLLFPRNCFPSEEMIQTSHITAFDDKGNPIRLAENTDLTALNAALAQLQQREFSSLMKAYPLREVAYEVNGICADIPFSIVLRKDGTGFIYHPSSNRYTLCHPLVSAENWIVLLDELTAK